MNVTRIRSFKLIIQPPAPIFLSDLVNRTQPAPDRHIHGSYGHENPSAHH